MSADQVRLNKTRCWRDSTVVYKDRSSSPLTHMLQEICIFCDKCSCTHTPKCHSKPVMSSHGVIEKRCIYNKMRHALVKSSQNDSWNVLARNELVQPSAFISGGQEQLGYTHWRKRISRILSELFTTWATTQLPYKAYSVESNTIWILDVCIHLSTLGKRQEVGLHLYDDYDEQRRALGFLLL